MARHFRSPPSAFHALRLRLKLANSLRLVSCLRRAAAVPLVFAASLFNSSTIIPGFKCRAKSGSWRRISHGVAYQR